MKSILLKYFLTLIFLLSFSGLSVAQDSSNTSTPLYYKLDSRTDSITSYGQRSQPVHPDSVMVLTDKAFPISGYILIPLIIGLVLTSVFRSIQKKKEIEFKKWNLENREKLRNRKR